MSSPWIFSRPVDLAVFVAPTLVALALFAVVRALVPGDDVPDAIWLAAVLGVDVAHVWATLHRTYLDRDELRRRPFLYSLVPIACYVAGVVVHARSAALFWRLLAYVAVFHFVRQQVGWAAIYRRKRGDGALARVVDEAAIYLAAIVPLFVWHTRLPRRFHWFVDGDFVDLASMRPMVPIAEIALAASLGVFAIVVVRDAIRRRDVAWGRVAIVGSTAVSWWLGIVTFDDDLAFTLLNVLPHGVPYFVLLFAYGRERAKTSPRSLGARIVTLGPPIFVASLVALAFVEESLWDRMVFHDRPHVFGAAIDVPLPLALVVPLLALPQATHYVLDAFLWRRGRGGAAQAAALGFAYPSPTR